jgi:hypothetical protein
MQPSETFLSNTSMLARPTWQRYGVAIATVLLGWIAREALTQAVGPTSLPFIFFFPAVAASTWFGGLGPGVLSVFLSAAMADWFFIGSAPGFVFGNINDVAAKQLFSSPVSALSPQSTQCIARIWSVRVYSTRLQRRWHRSAMQL